MAMLRYGAVCGFENIPSFDLQLVMPQFQLRDRDGMAEGIWVTWWRISLIDNVVELWLVGWVC